MKMMVFLFWVADVAEANGGYYTLMQGDGMRGYEGRWHLIASTEVEFDFPAFDQRELLISSLKAEKQEIINTATTKAASIEEKIQQLLALPQPEVERSDL